MTRIKRYRLCVLFRSVDDFLPTPSNLASHTYVFCIDSPASLPCPLFQMITIVHNLLIFRWFSFITRLYIVLSLPKPESFTQPYGTTAAVAQRARAVASKAEGWVFESQPRQTLVVKTGSDCSTAKRSAIGVSVTGPRR